MNRPAPVRLLWGALMLCGWLPAVANEHTIAYRGEARDPATAALLYAEQHLLRERDGRPQERLVLYRCPDGAAFARKSVRYGAAPQAPEFDLLDARFGYREGFELGSSFVQRTTAAALRREPVAADAALVVDAGFDEFVRARWDALQRGESLRLDFLVPSRLSAYGFRLRRLRGETLHGEPATVFRLGLSGLFGWFADAIEVAYRDRDRRLLRFDGVTNIRRDAEHNVVARIEFPPQPATEASAADWNAALQEPLTACGIGS